MPKKQVIDPITDQEITFARLVLSGTMTDRQAAEAAGLNPETAAYTKSKPRVRAYMLDHRAAVQEQLVQDEAEALRRLTVGREQVLARLWEIANLSPEATRNSITGQVKALAMIVAIEGLIPDRAEKPSAPSPLKPDVYVAEWLRQQRAQAAGLPPTPDLVEEEPAISDQPPAPGQAPSPTRVNEYDFAHLLETVSATVLDPTAAFSIKKEPYVRRFGPF